MYIQLHVITSIMVIIILGTVLDQIFVVIQTIIIMDAVKVIKVQLAIHIRTLQHKLIALQILLEIQFTFLQHHQLQIFVTIMDGHGLALEVVVIQTIIIMDAVKFIKVQLAIHIRTLQHKLIALQILLEIQFTFLQHHQLQIFVTIMDGHGLALEVVVIQTIIIMDAAKVIKVQLAIHSRTLQQNLIALQHQQIK
jgi:hypothetical protein